MNTPRAGFKNSIKSQPSHGGLVLDELPPVFYIAGAAVVVGLLICLFFSRRVKRIKASMLEYGFAYSRRERPGDDMSPVLEKYPSFMPWAGLFGLRTVLREVPNHQDSAFYNNAHDGATHAFRRDVASVSYFPARRRVEITFDKLPPRFFLDQKVRSRIGVWQYCLGADPGGKVVRSTVYSSNSVLFLAKSGGGKSGTARSILASFKPKTRKMNIAVITAKPEPDNFLGKFGELRELGTDDVDAIISLLTTIRDSARTVQEELKAAGRVQVDDTYETSECWALFCDEAHEYLGARSKVTPIFEELLRKCRSAGFLLIVGTQGAKATELSVDRGLFSIKVAGQVDTADQSRALFNSEIAVSTQFITDERKGLRGRFVMAGPSGAHFIRGVFYDGADK